ncbi:paraquat-inducible protein A [Nitratifractor sp.]
MSIHYLCCPECDEISSLPSLRRPGRYRCPNCGHTLFRHQPGMVEKIYALNLAALFLFIVTVSFPFLNFQIMGLSAEATFTTAFVNLVREQDYLLAVALLTTTLVVPAIRILLYLLLYGPLYHGVVPPLAAPMLKTLEAVAPWGMLDVFLVGVLVSIVKLVKMGEILPGTSLWAFAAMIVILAYVQSIFDPHETWERIDRAYGREPDLIRSAER